MLELALLLGGAFLLGGLVMLVLIGVTLRIMATEERAHREELVRLCIWAMDEANNIATEHGGMAVFGGGMYDKARRLGGMA